MLANSLLSLKSACSVLYNEKILSHALIPSWKNNLVLFICGVLATASLPPYSILIAHPLSFTTFFLFLNHSQNSKHAFKMGWWFGFGFFTTSIYWFSYALLVDAKRYGWLIPFAVGGIGGILALFYAISMILYHSISLRFSLTRRIVWFSFCIFCAEWARGHWFSGFPWNLHGYIWTFSDYSIQLGSLFGVYVLTGLTVFYATIPSLYLIKTSSPSAKRERRNITFLAIFSLIGLSYYCIDRVVNAENHVEKNIKIRIVQGNIPQSLKWDPQGRLEGVRTYSALSLIEGHENITHIIWPESAMTYSFKSQDYWAKELSSIVPKNGLLLTGTIRSETASDNTPIMYNSIQGLDNKGDVVYHYDKRHLVPFGEYIPLRSVLPIGKLTHGSVDFTAGNTLPILNKKDTPAFHPIICYESIFPELAYDAYPNWLLLITNDAWFGDSSAPYQHLAMGRMRAVEQGVPLIRAANTGISAVIDAYGRVLQSLPLNTEGVLDTHLPTSPPKPTPFNLNYTLIYLAYILGCVSYCFSSKKSII